MESLIVGHSQVKHFKTYICDPLTIPLCYPGCKVEDLLQKPSVRDLIPNVEVVAVVCGTNNIPSDTPGELLEKFEMLFYGILELNPSAKVVLSSILPRGENLHDDGKGFSPDKLVHINQCIHSVNGGLRAVSLITDNLSFVEHPKFIGGAQNLDRTMLARDGLHISYKGTKEVVNNLENAIAECQKSTSSSELDRTTQGPSCDNFSYSDAARFGNAKDENDTLNSTSASTTVTTSRQKSKHNSTTTLRRHDTVYIGKKAKSYHAGKVNRQHRTTDVRSAGQHIENSVTKVESMDYLCTSNRFEVLDNTDIIPNEPDITQTTTAVTIATKYNRTGKKFTKQNRKFNHTPQEMVGGSIEENDISIVLDKPKVGISTQHSDESEFLQVRIDEVRASANAVCDDKHEEQSDKTSEAVIPNPVRSEVEIENVTDIENNPHTNSGNRSKITIREGQTFNTFDEFRETYSIWCSEYSHPMKIDSSVKNTGDKNLPYQTIIIVYKCKHAGKPRIRGGGARPVQSYLACECQAVVRLKLDKKTNTYVILKLIDKHNHSTSSGEYKCYTSSRGLNEEEKQKLSALVDLGVETKNIKTFIKENTGKSVIHKDIWNIKHNITKENVAGRTQGQLLADVLKKITIDGATTIIDMDESHNIEMVYIQTKEMKDMFQKYPEIVFMDTTYNVNIEGYPLFAIMVEDGDGRGRPVAYCFLRSETKDNFNKVLDYFCKTNDVTNVDIVMVDKDLNEISVIKEHIPKANILLCKFHVMKYLKKKISDLDIKHEEKRDLANIIKQLVNARSSEVYDEVYDELKRCDSGFVEYYNANWHEVTELWVQYHRKTMRTHGNNTNNKIESHNDKVKHYVKRTMHLPEAIEQLMNFVTETYSKSSYNRYLNLKTRIDSRNVCDDMIKYSLVCNTRGFTVVNGEVELMNRTSYEVGHTDSGYNVVNGEFTHKVTDNLSKCDCTTFGSYGLPCRHILFCRKHDNVQLYDETLIPNRWRKEFGDCGQSTQFCTQTSYTISKSKSKAKKKLTVIDKFNMANDVCRDISSFLSNCGEAEFFEKLEKVKELKNKWQRSQRVSLCADVTVHENSRDIINDVNATANEGPTETVIDTEVQAVDPNETPMLVADENADVFTTMRNKLNIQTVQFRRGRPKGTKKAFWEFSRSNKQQSSKVSSKNKRSEKQSHQRQNSETTRRKTRRNEEKVNKCQTIEKDNKPTRANVNKHHGATNVPEKTNYLRKRSESNTQSEPKAKRQKTEKDVTIEEDTWVQTDRSKLTVTDKENILSGRRLNADVIETSQDILKTQFKNMNGFQPSVYKQNVDRFKQVHSNMLQVLFRGSLKNGHWFTVSTVGCVEGEINVFDSAYKDLDNDSLIQICYILKFKGNSIMFNTIPVQKQIGGSDCGLFAIAFATAIGLGFNPTKLLFEQDRMRTHLIECLTNKEFTSFPFRINTNCNKKKINYTKRDIFCVCRAIYDSSMIKCMLCNLWFHVRCLSQHLQTVFKRDSEMEYVCDKCTL